MFAVVEAPDFSLQALRRLEADLADAPVALLRGEGRRAVVACASPPAVQAGVGTGMTAAQALAECPALIARQPSPEAEAEAGAVLLAVCWQASPRVEATAPGLCTLDLAGRDLGQFRRELPRLRAQLQAHGLTCRIGVAANPLVARFAAHEARPERWVEAVRAFLAPLPMVLLEPTPEEESLLSTLGLSTLGALAKFPRDAVARRLGPRGDELWTRAAGEWHRPIQPAPHPTRFFAAKDLENAVETLEPLLFVLRRFLERLALELGQASLGTNRLRLCLRLEGGKEHGREFCLPDPTADVAVLFRVIENHLATVRTDSPVVGVELEAFPSRRLERQEGLFDTGLRDPPAFYETLAQVAAIVGTGQVGTPRRADTHRPDTVALVTPPAVVPPGAAGSTAGPRGLLLRRFRPPRPALVELTHGAPSFVKCPAIAAAITGTRGPWRSSGDWWQPPSWAREEWDIALTGGGLYRLLRTPDGWFLEGRYD
ncbi:MAG TPA: DNA polymerase Y family protein [Opitutaceae bacterium]|nr:DNA polymerase Y family protein [Opitutaceae bacterium]